jgi:TRAP-type uncharacterized transport system substrate-binding protein
MIAVFSEFPKAMDWKRRSTIIIASSVILLVAWYLIFEFPFSHLKKPKQLRAAKIPKGTYEKVIDHLEHQLNLYAEEMGFRIRLNDVESEGSIQTLAQIRDGKVDLGIVQGNSIITKKDAGVIAALYQEIYLFFSNVDGVTNLYQLAQVASTRTNRFKIACLGKGSQSFEDLGAIVEYYGFDQSKLLIRSSSYEKAALDLNSKSVDAAFFITGLQSKTIRAIARTPNVRLMAFPNREGLLRNLRSVFSFEIPPGTLGSGNPIQNVETLFTPALLVADQRLGRATIRSLTATLMNHHKEIEANMRFLSITPPPTDLQLPIHPGSTAFYKQSPSLIVRYDAIIKFAFSLLALVVSTAGLAFQLWKHRKERNAPAASREGPNSDPSIEDSL